MANHYSFVCDNGCGTCDVKVAPFVVYRKEDEMGNLIETKCVPDIVSSCCGGSVSVYDNVADEWLDGNLVYERTY